MSAESTEEKRLAIIVASPGSRDHIYVGWCEVRGNMFVLDQASMILRYESVGVTGLASEPGRATGLRPATGPKGRVTIPQHAVAAIIDADPAAWEGHLGVSR
jgi:hypothetical protein